MKDGFPFHHACRPLCNTGAHGQVIWVALEQVGIETNAKGLSPVLILPWRALRGRDSPMYKIIGADRKEYGPVSTEVICAWIADGRANGLTLAQAEGSTEWKPLLALPDFEMALAVHDGLRPGHPATMSGGAGFPGPRPDIPTYLVWSILCMVLCCPIPGVPALIYASQVNPKLDAGDLPGAKKNNSATAHAIATTSTASVSRLSVSRWATRFMFSAKAL